MQDVRYVKFDFGPWPEPSRALRLLGMVLPRANPDFDHAYQKITHWWLEIDGSGEVLREIGFDTNGQVLAIAPFRDNYGIFTDSGSPIDAAATDLDPQIFFDTWQAAEREFAA